MRISRRVFMAAVTASIAASAAPCPACCGPSPTPPTFATYHPLLGAWYACDRGQWRILSIDC